MRRLLESDDVIFLPLILEHIGFAVAVAEFDAAAVRKEKGALCALVIDRAVQFLLQRQHVVLIELR